MTATQPALFLAHGSPMLAIEDSAAHRFLRTLGSSLPRPKAIVILSPHWETEGLRVSAPGHLRTIHDFGGFPRALFEIRYPAEAPETLVDAVMARLGDAGIAASVDASWGLDHGAWVPLSLAFPEADIPVVALSLPLDYGPDELLALGAALSPLRDDGILLIATGSTTHNLRLIQPKTAPAADWAKAFDAWLDQGLLPGEPGRISRLDTAPQFRLAHPTEEHLLPVFFALGAGGTGARGELLHRSYEYGTLSMSYYRFAA
ncbi:dioxygenase family protein [Pannonibacter tanglangensis]|uniref:Dioxygenase n=1 Tax=Pannonibacter tanglangensis TaxID=2750084 RepID=A0ABW9ZL26_9HYPH|nr:class III extradiol ring-cleavage dioxygenase [Pannonibacter sp. XCT-34]NBN65618.1 dioxygenase [Pannonibacter sp. XCT-34]